MRGGSNRNLQCIYDCFAEEYLIFLNTSLDNRHLFLFFAFLFMKAKIDPKCW
jgi:hypothetical protein